MPRPPDDALPPLSDPYTEADDHLLVDCYFQHEPGPGATRHGVPVEALDALQDRLSAWRGSGPLFLRLQDIHELLTGMVQPQEHPRLARHLRSWGGGNRLLQR